MNQPPGIPNLMRFYRRRLGLTQSELAYVLGYDSDSQVSRIEHGSRVPHLSEVLIIELVFGVPGVAIFPEIREAVAPGISSRVRRLIRDARAAGTAHPRMSYKTAQLERVVSSLRSRDVDDLSGYTVWQA